MFFFSIYVCWKSSKKPASSYFFLLSHLILLILHSWYVKQSMKISLSLMTARLYFASISITPFWGLEKMSWKYFMGAWMRRFNVHFIKNFFLYLNVLKGSIKPEGWVIDLLMISSQNKLKKIFWYKIFQQKYI